MIHSFSIGGRHLVLDVESAALHETDKATLKVLEFLQDEKDINLDDRDLIESISAKAGLCLQTALEIFAELDKLAKAGKLFAASDNRHVKAHMENRRPVVKALCLHMAHECNLRCGYCFAGQGDYGTDRGLMSFEVGRKALDFLVSNSGARKNLEVDFFGGEPMLNFDVVKKLVTYGRSLESENNKVFRFTLTTNGSLLDYGANQYINEHMDNVVLSLDGRPDVNDKMRKWPKDLNSSTYDEICPKIKSMSETRGDKQYYVRGTYTRHNLDFAADVLHLADLGFKYISVEPVVAPPKADYAIRQEDVDKLSAEYEKLAAALLEREKEGRAVHFFHFEMNLKGGPCIAKRVTGCGAGSEYLAVTPSGKLYPCHQFVGEDSFCLGDLDSGIINRPLVYDFGACCVFSKPECAACWAKYYCSGGCMATAYHMHGNINKPDPIGCQLQKKRIEVALYMAAMRKI